MSVDPADIIVVGDWDCDGVATPAVLRVPSGAIDVVDHWPTNGEPTITAANHGHRRRGRRRGATSWRTGMRHARRAYPRWCARGEVVRRPLALLVIAVAAGSALWRLASRFPLPRRDIGRWLVEVGPADAAMSVLRAAALGAALYLTVIALLHLLVPTTSRAARWITSLTLPSLRAVLVTTVLATSGTGAAFAGTGRCHLPR